MEEPAAAAVVPAEAAAVAIATAEEIATGIVAAGVLVGSCCLSSERRKTKSSRGSTRMLRIYADRCRQNDSSQLQLIRVNQFNPR
jgi:hypothetical protein